MGFVTKLMRDNLPFVSMLACPSCAGDIRETTDHFACASCKKVFPSADGVPCLFKDPSATIDLWKAQVLEFIVGVHNAVESLSAAAGASEGFTRQRLIAMADATALNVGVLDGLLSRLPLEGMGGPSQTRSPESLLRNFEYLHKDWGWRGTAGDDENINAIAAIQKVAPGPLGRTLVLGSGASRLAYDLHKDEADITVALDNDPLLVLVAKRIVAGETIELVEAPTEVTQMSQLATTRNLCAPRGAVHGIHFLLANGLMPPFKAAQFDTVVTPWFIDQATSDAHADMSSLLAQISRVLRPGGQWICQGPLVYRRHTPAANRYTQEELFALIAKAGFALGDCQQSDVAHLRSPLGGFGRFHRVLTFVAKRPG